MDKEMKKLLLVAVSVGVFLLVTITAAILVVTPKVNTQEAAFTSSHPITSGRVMTEAAGTPAQPVSEITEETTLQPVISNVIEANIFNRESSGSTAAVERSDGDRLTIPIPRPTTAAVPDDPGITPAAAEAKPAAVATAPAAAAPAVKPAVTAQTSRPAAAQPKPASTPKPAAAPRPAQTQAKAINDYWVQTGAFIAKIRAEDAKETLASKGITSIIENRQVDGRTWYRVRLGPYTSEKEANYWLALVKAIDGFGESQVRQTVRQQ